MNQTIQSDAMRYAQINQASKAKRALYRKSSPQLLRAVGLQYTTHNEGAHLVVRTAKLEGVVVDFWPGTGLWRVRDSTEQGRGVKPLIAWFAVKCNQSSFTTTPSKATPAITMPPRRKVSLTSISAKR